MKQYLFSVLSTHAKIHKHLDSLNKQYRDVLREIEKKEILAYNNEKMFDRLEGLKSELLEIQFRDPSP